MKSLATLLLVAGSSLLAGTAQAQYTFTNAALAPYTQNFNGLSGTVGMTGTAGNQLSGLPEVFAQAEFGTLPNTVPFPPPSIGANDGSAVAANYYHFGYAGASGTDRSLGGIAATTTADGIGYVGIRFKNGSSVTIKNLEVQYAMEQWYNSGRQDAASVSVSYLTAPVGTAITSLLERAGTWQAIAPLQVDAPSTSTVIASRDGNAAANRRVRQTTLTGLNLLPGQEIMLRWGYTLNNTSNGNGLSIDDVVVTPETNVYYAKTAATNMLDDLATWGTNRDGSGTAPASFTADNQVFYVLGAATDRITAVNATGILGTWAVGGANSKIVVGLPATATTGTAAVPASLYLEYSKNIVGTIDVSDGSTFVIRNTNPLRTFGLGSLSLTSTVEYNGTTPTSIITQSYGNLVISGSAGATVPSVKTLTGSIIVNGGVLLKNQCSLSLDNYDLTLVRRDSMSGGIKLNRNIVRGGSPKSYVVTGGTGRLRISVPSNGRDIVFPVGSLPPTVLTTAYTPATLQQTTLKSEDIFGVRVIDNLYLVYNLLEAGLNAALSQRNVNKTWLVSEEVPGGSDLTLALQWNTLDATLDFVPAQAHLNHYMSNAWDEHTTASEWGTTPGASANTWTAKRTHITSFSPFGVVSAAPAPLPVKLTYFNAQALRSEGVCIWETASETNNDHFVVERSLDGVAFVPLGTVRGQGTTATAHTYRWVDAEAGHLGVPTVYYRLQQTDTDARVSYSPVRTITFAAPAVALYPTPTAGAAATLDLTSLAPQPYQTQVLDIAGRVLLTRTYAGGQAHPFDLQGLPAGAYLVVITGADTRQTLPLLRN